MHEIREPADDVIGEIVHVRNGQHIVLVRQEGLVFTRIPLAARKGQPLNVKGIAPEHTANGIGNEGHDHIPLIEHIAHLALFLVRLVDDAVHRDITVGHLGRQFVLQAIDVDKDAVEFFLVGFELGKAREALGFPGFVLVLDQFGHDVLLITSDVIRLL